MNDLADLNSRAETGGANTPTLRVDFAGIFQEHLLVYGWVLGLFQGVARAEIRYGDVVIDLMSLGIPVPRPDVTQHFGSQVPPDDDNHGFCLLVALPDSKARISYLRLSAVLHSGEVLERVWPVGFGDSGVINFFQRNQATLHWLLEHLPPLDAERLRDLNSPSIPDLPVRADLTGSHAVNLKFGVDLCVVLDHRYVVVVGWLDDRDKHLTSATGRFRNVTVDLLQEIEFTGRPYDQSEASITLHGNVVPQAGFTWVTRLTHIIHEG